MSGSSPLEIKDVFRNGWSHAGRVQYWASISVHGEFADPLVRAAWIKTLSVASAGVPIGEAADMGCGPGTITQLWAEMGWNVTGLDFSPTMLRTAGSAARDRGLSINLQEGDVESPSLGVERFNVVSSRLVLFTLPHPGLAIRRWVEMLRPGGRLVLIGEDHTFRKDKPTVDAPEKEKPPGMWQADDEYRRALSQLDFMQHHSKTLRVVMEAAGVEQVHYVPMQGVIMTRNGGVESEPGISSGGPFILVGTKPV